MSGSTGRLPEGTRAGRTAWLAAVAVSLLFQSLTLRNVVLGQFRWHVSQPASTQGGLELLAVLAIMGLAARRPRRFAPVVALVSALYLRLHLVLEVAVVSWCYLEALLQIGSAVLSLARATQRAGIGSFLQRFVAGVAFWALAAFTVSLAGFGRPPHLVALTLALALGAALVRAPEPLLTWLWRRSRSLGASERALVALLVSILLMQLAKGVSAIDYDSIWYGLRPQYVLYGAHSLFDPLGYAHFVYYYPKLFELLTLPVTVFPDYAYIYGVNAALLSLLMAASFQLARRTGAGRADALVVAAVASSVPAVANMASTAKPDILATLLVVVAAGALLELAATREPLALAVAGGAVLLSFTAKLTSLVYVPPLLLGLAAVAVPLVRAGSAAAPRRWRSPALVAVPGAAMLVLLLSTLRTYMLTGYPTVPVLVGLWRALGLRPRYPLSDTLPSGFTLAGLPADGLAVHWGKLLFQPSGMVHWVMVWPGNAVAFALLAAACAWSLASRGRAGKPGPGALIVLACAPVLATGAFYASTVRDGGDGNYYQIPVVLVISTALAYALAVSSERATLRLAALLFLPLQLVVTLVSHFSWQYGTAPFSLDFSRSLVAARSSRNQAEFERYGIAAIARFLAQTDASRSRCIGTTSSGEGIEEQTLYKLACGYEDVKHINWVAREVTSDEHALTDYVARVGVRYLIVPRGVALKPASFAALVASVRGSPTARAVVDASYLLIVLAPTAEEAPWLTSIPRESPAPAPSDRGPSPPGAR
jgi:hypothetical protein